jgi:hypothetical protein
MSLLLLAGCGPHKQISITRGVGQLPTISPLVSSGHLWGFALIFRTASPRELLINVDEGTFDRRSPCWRSYAASAVEASPYPVVSLVPTSKPNKAVCAEPGVGPLYVPLHLPVPYTGADVVDAATGRVIKIQPRVSYTASELVGS